MSISIVLYGDLKPKGQQRVNKGSKPLLISIKSNKINTIYDILEKLSIKEDEISHIFVNHNYCGPGIEVKDGDRVALFPRRMALMFEEIPHSNSIEVKVKLSADLRKFGSEIYLVDIPKGSSISIITKKFNIPLEKGKLNVLINDIPCNDKKYILKEKDVITLF